MGGQLLYDYVGSHIIISTPIGLLKGNSSLVTENDREAQADSYRNFATWRRRQPESRRPVYDRAAMTAHAYAVEHWYFLKDY